MFTDLRVGSGLEEEKFESYTLIRVYVLQSTFKIYI